MLNNLRKYGKEPFKVAVIHGGPGAPGQMAPVARELSPEYGVLEPFQASKTIKGLVEELKNTLEEYGTLPVILIGFSWGAWLSYIFSANYPEFVSKVIMVGSGPFEQSYAESIEKTRLSRLSHEEQNELNSIMDLLAIPTKKQDLIYKRFGELFTKADAYDPVDLETGIIEFDSEVFLSVWGEAEELRKSGFLLNLSQKIRCPVTEIHGDYDPHPAEGVEKPLSGNLEHFSFYLLEKCGHMPWIEKNAGKSFFEILRQELLISGQQSAII